MSKLAPPLEAPLGPVSTLPPPPFTGGGGPTVPTKLPIVRLGTPLILPPGYGCVVVTGLSSMLLVLWKSMKVSEARRDFKIPVPVTHSETCVPFNCIYRWNKERQHLKNNFHDKTVNFYYK